MGSGKDERGRMDLRDILNTPKLAKERAGFMIRKRHLRQFRAVLEEASYRRSTELFGHQGTNRCRENLVMDSYHSGQPPLLYIS
ncbi:hypothetical protein B0O99DRAFT_82442 [Bisporella sp. PMI_857]|nr:hypothetical protein B0O99DRAFT_82442 [Bisporella sp. PMI_857]